VATRISRVGGDGAEALCNWAEDIKPSFVHLEEAWCVSISGLATKGRVGQIDDLVHIATTESRRL
jgi:hypothetical protein